MQWHLTSARHVAWHLNSDFCWLQFKSRYESYQISYILHRDYVQTNVPLFIFSSIVSLVQNLLCTSKFVSRYKNLLITSFERYNTVRWAFIWTDLLFWADIWHKGVKSFLNYQTFVQNHCSRTFHFSFCRHFFHESIFFFLNVDQ